jgi:His-Xaa-Ser system protein HxsD
MSDIKVLLGDGAVELELDEGLYPKDAVYGAAYVFIDRCYVHLDRAGDRRIKVTLRAKKGKIEDSAAYAGEFENELLGQAWRRQLVEENRQLVESITARALAGAAGPPGLDELLAMDIGEATAFDDPLGIAMSWEEKYKKKGGGAADKDAAQADAGAADRASGAGATQGEKTQ